MVVVGKLLLCVEWREEVEEVGDFIGDEASLVESVLHQNPMLLRLSDCNLVG